MSSVAPQPIETSSPTFPALSTVAPANSGSPIAASSPPVSPVFGNIADKSLAELQAEYHQIIELKRQQEEEKANAERERFADKVRGLPAVLGVKTLEEVAAAIRAVLGPKSVGHRVSGVQNIDAFKPLGKDDKYDRACAAIRAGASQKQISDAFGYSISWYYKTKRELGLSMKYKTPPGKPGRKGRFPVSSAKK